MITRITPILVFAAIVSFIIVARAAEERPVSSSEQQIIAKCDGVVARTDSSLHIKGGGKDIDLVDTDENSASGVRDYTLEQCLPDLGLVVVGVGHYESSTLLLIDIANGSTYEIAGPFHPSPSGRALIIIEPFPSGGSYYFQGIEVFHRDENGTWDETWDYLPKHGFYNSEFVAWDTDETLRVLTTAGLRSEDCSWLGFYSKIHVTPKSFEIEDGPMQVLADTKGKYVDRIPGTDDPMNEVVDADCRSNLSLDRKP